MKTVLLVLAGIAIDQMLMYCVSEHRRSMRVQLFIITSLNCQTSREVIIRRLATTYSMSPEKAQSVFDQFLEGLLKRKGMIVLGSTDDGKYRLTAQGQDIWNHLRTATRKAS